MTGKELYQIAKKYLGKGGATFRKFCGLASNAPYCCAYVCYIFFTNSLNKLFYGGKKVTYCPNAIKWCQANLAQLPLYMAMPMDIAFFDWNKNGIPDHIGFIKAKISSDKIATHEGNTSGGIVAEKTRTVGYMMGGVFRPHYAPKGLKKEVLAVDGDFGYRSVYMLQVMLCVKADGIFGKVTLKAFQRKLGVAPDASWGRKTTLAAQRLVGVKDDGEWGPASTRALQTYINKECFSSTIDKPSQDETKDYQEPEELKLKCIDVSYWQGNISVENWKKVKKTCGYAICRASYTSQRSFTLNKDSTFADNFVNAKAVGLKVGAYHYSQAITVDEAKREAEYLCEILKNYDPTFYVVCDFEFGGRLNKNIGIKASDIANAFCDVVKARGYDPCIYANTNTLTNYLKNPKYPVWVAQYNDTCTYKGSKVMWQYTSSGKVDGIDGRVDLSHVYTAPAPIPEKESYKGEFPNLVAHSAQKIAKTATDLSYAYGTAKSKYTYPKSNAKPSFVTAINKVFPKRSSWSKQSQAGASCDVGSGTAIRYSGYDTKIPRGLSEQIPHLQKSSLWKDTGLKKGSQMKPGDVGIWVSKSGGGHIWIKVDGAYTAEASRTNKYYMRITKSKPTSSNKKVWGIFRAVKPSSISKGDKGTEVKKLQDFLNWAGFNCGTADGIFGDNTLKAVKAFQDSNGLTQDGIVGPKTIEKMKTTRS